MHYILNGLPCQSSRPVLQDKLPSVRQLRRLVMLCFAHAPGLRRLCGDCPRTELPPSRAHWMHPHGVGDDAKGTSARREPSPLLDSLSPPYPPFSSPSCASRPVDMATSPTWSFPSVVSPRRVPADGPRRSRSSRSVRRVHASMASLKDWSFACSVAKAAWRSVSSASRPPT